MLGCCWGFVGKDFLRWADEEGDDDAPVDGNDATSGKGLGMSSNKKQAKQAKAKQASKAKAKQVKPDASKPKAEKSLGKKQHGAYIAGDYSARRQTWIQKRKDKFHMSHRDACNAWNDSKTRARLLEDMPHAEKVRRRFV